MTDKLRKSIAVFAACAMLTSVPVMAEYIPGKDIDPNVASTKMVKPAYTIVIDGSALTEAACYVSGETVMIPLRAVSEALGYEVKWNEEARRIELIKGAHYITLTPDEDGYTFAKMAPVKLGKAPELKNDVTYVPVNFLSEIMQLTVTVEENGSIQVSTGETTPVEATREVSVIEKGENSLTVFDKMLGEVVLNLSDETEIKDENGAVVSLTDLDESKALDVTFGEIMTASLPPHNTPVSIVVKDAMSDKYVKGSILEVGESSITIGDKDDVSTQLILNVSEDTVLTDANNKSLTLKDFEAGGTIEALTSRAYTKSLPPQSAASFIRAYTPIKAEGQDPEQKPETAVSRQVSVIEKGENSLMVYDKEMGEVILHIGEETKITDGKGDTVSFADLDVTKALEVEYSPAMALSLPPQNTPVSIKILDTLAPVYLKDTIAAISKDEDDISITLGDKEDINKQTIVHLSGETEIVNLEGEKANAEDLEEGMAVIVLTSPAYTMSIPPQTSAQYVRITDAGIAE